jgi:hypothetical protein
LKNIFIRDRRFFAIAIGFLLLFSFIPYLHNNVYGQIQPIINGTGFGSVICASPPPGGPPSGIGNIFFQGFGTTDGTVTSGSFNVGSSIGPISGQITGGEIIPSTGQYTLTGQFRLGACSTNPNIPFTLSGECSEIVNNIPQSVDITLSSAIVTGEFDGPVLCTVTSTDTDRDDDGVPNESDNCPDLANPDQANNDGDALGDVCDNDDDNDGVEDTVDNCPLLANTNQADADNDGIGDVCDDDRDGDGVNNNVDNCPAASNPNQADADNDGIGDVCDDDRDGDGVLNEGDNCPEVANTNQADADNDGIGDVCDDDRDGDGVSNGVDNCPEVANPNQADMDGDTVGDACDPDKDGDGVSNGVDNCPEVANPNQADFDNDGIGDVCDDETSLTVFKNQGQCIAFVNNNPEDAETLGITKEKCQEAF